MAKQAYLSRVSRHEVDPFIQSRSKREIEGILKAFANSKRFMQRMDLSNSNASNLLGRVGLIAPTDHVTTYTIGLPQGRNIAPFYPSPGSVSYFRQEAGETVCRLGNSYQRFKEQHAITPGEVVRIEGNGKRAFEAKPAVPSLGFLFEVATEDFDEQALVQMAEPFVSSSNPDRANAARLLLGEVINGDRELVSARARVEHWYQEANNL